MDVALPPPTGGSVTATEATSSSAPENTSTTAGAVPTAPVAASVPVSQAVVASSSLREDQVKNAVDFLSHPQVRSSTNTASKRSFLERKGLSAAEIDEAFRRVPEAPPAPAPVSSVVTAAAAPAAPTVTAVQPVTYLTQPSAQGQQLAVTQQPYSMAPAPGAGQLVPMQPTAVQAPAGYRWSQVVLGVGLVAAAGWAVQQLVLPRLRAMVDSWAASRREAEEARLKELTAAVEKGLEGCQEELKQSTQALMEAVTFMREQQRVASVNGGVPARGAAPSSRQLTTASDMYYPAITPSANRYDQQQYVGNTLAPGLPPDNYAAIRAAAGYTNAYPPEAPSYTVCSGPPTAGPTGGDNSRVGGSGAPVYGTPTFMGYPGQRTTGNGPFGAASGNTGGAPASENLPYKVTAPPSPTNSIYSQQSGRPTQQQTGGMGPPYGSSDRLYEQPMNGVRRDPEPSRTLPPAPPEQPEYPRSFHEVMAMVQQGITPPNVRTDIDDSPPDPTRPLSESRIPAPSKPWERNSAAAGGSSGSANSNANTLYGASPSSSAGGTGGGYSPYSTSMAGPYKPAGGAAPWNPSSSAPTSSSDSAGAAAASGRTGGGGSTNLSVLPPANPAWRPPPPPMRTVVSSSPSSPPTTSSIGMTAGPGSSGGGAAAAADGAAGALPAAPSPPPPPPSPPAAPQEPTAAARAPPVAVGSPQLAAAAVSSDMAPPSPPPSAPSYVAAETGQSAVTADGPGISGNAAAEVAGVEVAIPAAAAAEGAGEGAAVTATA